MEIRNPSFTRFPRSDDPVRSPMLGIFVVAVLLAVMWGVECPDYPLADTTCCYFGYPPARCAAIRSAYLGTEICNAWSRNQ